MPILWDLVRLGYMLNWMVHFTLLTLGEWWNQADHFRIVIVRLKDTNPFSFNCNKM